MFCFEKQYFVAANMFPLPGPMSEYNILLLDNYSFIKLKTVLKGLIVVEKRRLGFDALFSPFRGQLFEFCGPKTHDANSNKPKGGNPFL